MNEPMLNIENLRAGYGRAAVLHGVSLTAARGSVVTVIGPNGAGKSTLLNALMGVLPVQGSIAQCSVQFGGRDITRDSLEARVMQGIALVPERRELFGSMPVEDNLLLGAYRHRRRGPAWTQERLAEVFQRFPRLEERRRQLAGTLSGGERQMLAIGRALMSAPELLMLDEPSLGLAPLIVREIFACIESLRRTGVTILLVEQNARAALEVADHAYVLEMGEIALSGPASALIHDARVVETYLGASRKERA